MKRREFVRQSLLGMTGAAVLPWVGGGCRTVPAAGRARQGWELVPEILARIVPPAFPDREFKVTQFGARGDGVTDCTDAFRQAVASCHAAGGGRVVVPEGRFLTGPIHLADRVNLHVSAGATIAFHTDPRRYLPAVFTRWEGMELMGYSPLVYAFGARDVAITGTGTLDGQADERHWWPWKGPWKGRFSAGPETQAAARQRLMELVERGAPVAERQFADGSFLRPQFIQPYRCRNVLIEGIRVIRSPMWEINPVLCSNVTVRNVVVESHGPNNDGCNPESCRDVLIDGCEFDTGDDCIAIKSGRNADGRRLAVPSENIVVRSCRMKDGHGGVTLGSEISGGVRNVFVERCTMDSPHLERALRFKNNAMRGGVLEHIYMRDVQIGQLADAVVSIDLHYEEGEKGAFIPIVRDVELRNVTSRKSRYVIYARAYPRSEISDVRLIGCRFDGVEGERVADGVQRLTLQDVFINGRRVA